MRYEFTYKNKVQIFEANSFVELLKRLAMEDIELKNCSDFKRIDNAHS